MGAIPSRRSGAAQPRGQNKGNCSSCYDGCGRGDAQSRRYSRVGTDSMKTLKLGFALPAATSLFDGHVSGFNVETIHYFQLKSNLKMNIDYSSDLKARLLAHDSFTQDNASLIEESEKSRSAAFKENKLLESLDVDPINNPFNVDSFRRPHRTLNDSQQIVFTSKSLYRWILTVVLGIGIAFCAYFIQNAITVTPILGSRTKRFRLTGVVRRC